MRTRSGAYAILLFRQLNFFIFFVSFVLTYKAKLLLANEKPFDLLLELFRPLLFLYESLRKVASLQELTNY